MSLWQQKSVNRRIFTAMVTVGGLTFLVKLFAMGKELIVAGYFGTGDALDAFLIAFLLPSFAVSVVAGSFGPAFVPVFIQVRENEGRDAAQRLLSAVIFWSTVLLIAVAILLALVGPYVLPVLGSGFNSDKLGLTRLLFFFVLPVIVLAGLSTLFAATLNAGARFALAAAAPAVTSVLIIIALTLMGREWGIYAIAAGTLAGFGLEAGLLAWALKRGGFSAVPRRSEINSTLKQIMGQYMPVVAGSIMMSGTALVDQSMAAMLEPGSVSALNYGNKVVSVILGVGSAALGTAVLPHFSHMAAVGDWAGTLNTFKKYTRLILLVSVPLTIVFVFFSEPVVRLLFERGSFSGDDTRLVGNVQALYSLQVPFYSLSILITRLISSLQANYLLTRAAVINFFLNVVLNYLFIIWLGVAGIALSTSVVYFVSCCYLWYMLSGLLRKEI